MPHPSLTHGFSISGLAIIFAHGLGGISFRVNRRPSIYRAPFRLHDEGRSLGYLQLSETSATG